MSKPSKTTKPTTAQRKTRASTVPPVTDETTAQRKQPTTTALFVRLTPDKRTALNVETAKRSTTVALVVRRLVEAYISGDERARAIGDGVVAS